MSDKPEGDLPYRPQTFEEAVEEALKQPGSVGNVFYTAEVGPDGKYTGVTAPYQILLIVAGPEGDECSRISAEASEAMRRIFGATPRDLTIPQVHSFIYNLPAHQRKEAWPKDVCWHCGETMPDGKCYCLRDD